ncbi:MAG: hypothetical protein LBE91_06840 [Tannerella sp.]|jgi:hypothetical protein|nr:hypothetical protein [Tannerella sp.]
MSVMKYRAIIPCFGDRTVCSVRSNILVEKHPGNLEACRRYAIIINSGKNRVPTARSTGWQSYFYQYFVPNGTSRLQKNFMELVHSVRNASLGRKVIHPQDAFRTECDRQRETFSTERYSLTGMKLDHPASDGGELTDTLSLTRQSEFFLRD